MSRLQFLEEPHVYLLDGAPIPSNTQILKACGYVDDAWYTPEARIRGTEVHAACWYLCEGDLDWSTVKAGYVPYLEAFQQFLRDSQIHIDFNEVPVWGNAIFGTRIDIMGVLWDAELRRQVRALIDIKTGAVQDWVRLQLWGQQIAITDRIQAQDEVWTQRIPYVNKHPYPEARFSLALGSNGKYRLKKWPAPSDREKFLEAVAEYHHRVAA